MTVLSDISKRIVHIVKQLVNLLLIRQSLLQQNGTWVALKVRLELKWLFWFNKGKLIQLARRDIYFCLRLLTRRTQLNHEAI